MAKKNSFYTNVASKGFKNSKRPKYSEKITKILLLLESENYLNLVDISNVKCGNFFVKFSDKLPEADNYYIKRKVKVKVSRDKGFRVG
jgi:hypothetical protein